MTSDHTGPSLASEAARIIQMTDEELIALARERPGLIRSMAGSLLTQVEERGPDP